MHNNARRSKLTDTPGCTHSSAHGSVPPAAMQRYLVTSKGADVWSGILKDAGIRAEAAAFVTSAAYDDALLHR